MLTDEVDAKREVGKRHKCVFFTGLESVNSVKKVNTTMWIMMVADIIVRGKCVFDEFVEIANYHIKLSYVYLYNIHRNSQGLKVKRWVPLIKDYDAAGDV